MLPWIGGAALASILHVAGHPLPSHCHHPIVVVQLSSSNCRPQIAAVVFIDIIAIVVGGGIIAIAIAVAVTIVVAVTVAIAVTIPSPLPSPLPYQLSGDQLISTQSIPP